MTYKVSAEKLQELNVLIDKGGHVPGAVSDALAALEVATAAGDKAAAKVAFDRAVNANINGNAKAWTAVQGWHDQVKASGEDGPQPEQPETPVPEGHVLLPITGHVVPLPVAGEGILSFYMRVCPIIGGRPESAASLQQWLGGEGAISIVPLELRGLSDQWPLLVDAFVNGITYKIATNGGDTPGMISPRIGTTSDWGPVIGKGEVTHWVNTAQHEVRSMQATADGSISSVHGSGAAKVYGSISATRGGPPLATSWGTGSSQRMEIKAGQWFSTYHTNEAGGLMRCSMN